MTRVKRAVLRYLRSNLEKHHKGAVVSKESKFLIYAIGYYRNKKRLTGAEVSTFFSRHNIYQLILDNYFLYHIESPNIFVNDIDHFVAQECTHETY